MDWAWPLLSTCRLPGEWGQLCKLPACLDFKPEEDDACRHMQLCVQRRVRSTHTKACMNTIGSIMECRTMIILPLATEAPKVKPARSWSHPTLRTSGGLFIALQESQHASPRESGFQHEPSACKSQMHVAENQAKISPIRSYTSQLNCQAAAAMHGNCPSAASRSRVNPRLESVLCPSLINWRGLPMLTT